jgi:hypothetical protein
MNLLTHFSLCVMVGLSASAKDVEGPAYFIKKVKFELNGKRTQVVAEGKVIASAECAFQNQTDVRALNEGLVKVAGGQVAAQVVVQVKGFERYCALRQLHHECLYKSDGEGCKPEDMKTLEKAESEGYDFVEVNKDVARFVSVKSTPAKQD